MPLLQAIRKKYPQHKYAINAVMLGDTRNLAWSNLGLWQTAQCYSDAGQALAEHLAQLIHLNSKDRLLDLACGQGASIELWNKKYNIQNISAVELQPECVNHLQNHAPFLNSILCDSFLNLTSSTFPQKFDAVLCIDAAYHVVLNTFLSAIQNVLAVHGRLGFHTLMLHDHFFDLTLVQQKKYMFLLKAADVNLRHLMCKNKLQCTIMKHGFSQVFIQDLSENVLQGFANYIDKGQLNLTGLDGFKIKITAKLCAKLFRDGWIRYVAIAVQ